MGAGTIASAHRLIGMTLCRQCGEENPDRFRICGMCGAPLAAASPRRDARKTVTVVFSDLKGSTDLGERLDSESLRDALGVYFDEMRAVIERHGGVVEKYIGDAIMAVFGLPAVREDDATRAVRAAHEMQARLANVNDDLRERWGIELAARIGVNTGEVVAGDPAAGQRLVTGDTVNTAARLEQAAGAGDVLIGQLTYELVRDAVEVSVLEPLELKGKAERVAVYRLVGVAPAQAHERRLGAPLVGRSDELARLAAAEATARTSRRAALVTIVAAAGVGKSRLIHEFLASGDRRARSLRGRCLSYGDGITFWPIAEMIRTAAALDDDVPAEAARQRLITLAGGRDDVAARIAPLLALSDETYPLEETFWAVRSVFEGLAATAPLVVVVDDIHWAEPTLLELLEHVRATATAPIILIASARPELLEERPEWGRHDATLRLDPLTGAETEAVVANILGDTDLPAELVHRIIDAAEGNPLFVEQVLSMLVDAGDLARDAGGRWRLSAASKSVPVPPGIVALVDARLDRLGSEDRAVLQAGSVIGLVFYRGAVRSISAADIQPRVDRSLELLEERQFIRPDASSFLDDEAFRFDHALIHDGAYRSLLKRERAELHERFGRWLEEVAASRLAELEEIVGYHFEQAASHLAQLGPLDEHGLVVGEMAATRLANAGRRALSRGDSHAAANLLERAAALLPSPSRRRVEVVLDLAEATADLGEFDRSTHAASEALAAAHELGDELAVRNAELVSLFLRYTLDPADESGAVVRETEAAIGPLERADDHAGLVRAWRLLAWVHGTACRYGAAELAVERAVHHARMAGDRRAETRNLMSFAVSALYGPMPVPRARALAARISGEVHGDRRAEGIVLSASAHLAALDGDFLDARALYARARETLETLGGPLMAATVSLDSARVELLAGDAIAAERELRRDEAVLEAVGERYARSTITGLLGYALLRQGRPDDALVAAESAAGMAAPDDVESQSLWRRVRAGAVATTGSVDDALALASEAYAMVADTDAPLMKAYALLDLGEVQEAAGRSSEAAQSWRRALSLLEAKQARAPADQARGLLRSRKARV
jgi:class 3 adenylate cyclase/tetratricopeptide (TPR) repeat protein